MTDRVVLRRCVAGALETNTWVVRAPDSRDALLVDPGDDPERLAAEVQDLRIQGIVLTHAHWDHVLALPLLAELVDAPVLAHPAATEVWAHELEQARKQGHWDAGTATGELLPTGLLDLDPGRRLWDGRIDGELADGQELVVGGLVVRVVHTPGHTPDGVTLAMPGHLLTGDTLFPGGPGLTGWPLSDFDTIMTSVEHLLTAYDVAVGIHPGHGDSTTVGAEAPSLQAWRARGW
ncbi:glyoxylase-like metal-dependent hydrolase (beta-lactamase superfamily II) [Kribbella voronezhensis]|uniref:Glyoxylase-like metal-dependent hydrolase (Beta-lactamase superfamily II) n=1 Tax=Kribbella voronezhensis TaxID=2512212 RepID=A0A4R7T840_9ACTN|nr:MBL fold metallo-hydrolase [Kribbella voronezhensis]TDU88110.1 glyoxylase-like metal-dependent hydrolase (beta-lactamase superfamily II) [Kribbella voronezhensis]